MGRIITILILFIFYTSVFAEPYSKLRIFDFDCTITIDESFQFPIDDPEIIMNNIKSDILDTLHRKNSLFAISSFIDSPENIVAYLREIYHASPKLQFSQAHYLYNSKRDKTVLAFTLYKYEVSDEKNLITITTLPKRTGEIDKETGEKNLAYKMAREALENGAKNIPISIIANTLAQDNLIDTHTHIYFYDDEVNNTEHAAHLELFGRKIKAYDVIPHTKVFSYSRHNINYF